MLEAAGATETMSSDPLTAPEQLRESMEAVRRSPAWLSYLAAPTAASREYAKEALVAIQLAYLSSVLAIAVCELAHPTLPRAGLLAWWVAESLGNFVLRMALYARFVFPARLVQFTGSRSARLIPLVANLVVGVHWMWTVHLFVGPKGPMLVVVVVSYLLMSVAAMSIAASSPITAILYPGFLWVPLFARLASESWVSPIVLLVMFAAITGTLCMAFFTVARHVRKYLMKNDEVLVLLDQVHRSNAELQASNAQLADHRARVQAELEARCQYFSSVHHDLRQRLHATRLMGQSVMSASGSDRTMLTRLLENLVSNAIKFTRPGGGVLVAARRFGGGLSIEVWDQGPGIPEVARHAIFKAFYQLPYYGRCRDGVGMGLAIVERLAKCLGYRVVVGSREGKGTVMRVQVPADVGSSDERRTS